jgi:hypothetical protein
MVQQGVAAEVRVADNLVPPLHQGRLVERGQRPQFDAALRRAKLFTVVARARASMRDGRLESPLLKCRDFRARGAIARGERACLLNDVEWPHHVLLGIRET